MRSSQQPNGARVQRIRRLLSPLLVLILVAGLLTLWITRPAARRLSTGSASTRAQPAGRPAAAAALAFRAGFHTPPRFPLKQEHMLVREATERHTLTVIELHGLGAAASELPFRAALADTMPWVKWVAPQARILNVTVRGGEPTTAWFDIATFQDLYEAEDADGLRESQREVHRLIREERQVLRNAGRAPRVAVAGFSQGAIMSLLSALTAEEPLEGAMLLSGYLPLPDKAHLIGPLAPNTTPIFWGHGHADPYLRANLATQGVFALRRAPFALDDIEYRMYPHLEHYWSLEELADLREWAEARLPVERIAHGGSPRVAETEELDEVDFSR